MLPRQIELGNSLCPHTHIKQKLIYATRPRKFVSAFKTDNIFTKAAIKSLLNRKWWYYENSQKLHAEIRLLTSLASEGSEKITLGISKLCCKLCAAGVSALKKTYQLDVELRGRHGNFYFGWKPSKLLLDYCFKSFVGKKADSIFKEVNQQTQKEILSHLEDLETHRVALKEFFTPERGNVNLNSDSPAPISTESAKSEEASDNSVSSEEEPEDSSSDISIDEE